MAYLRSKDYLKQIQTDNLNQIISNDSTILASAELEAQAEIISYLTQKYDVAREFRDTVAYDNSATYKADYLVEYNSELYYLSLPYSEFNNDNYYKVGDQVFWKDKTYTCLIATPILDHETALQYQSLNRLPQRNIFPDDPTDGKTYWGAGVSYSVSGIVPTDTTKWTKGDNRNAQIVMIMIDIALYHVHCRIAPRNIPQIRIDRYDMALKWLRMAARGEITADIPVIQPKQGYRVRYGGNIKNINSY